MSDLKVAVVTPYYKEPADKLKRCIESVRAQTYKNIMHYLVADGFPSPVVDSSDPALRHITLPVSHSDNGNTPRGIGAICALNEGADIICFLDADNLFLPEHAESVVAKFKAKRLGAVFSYRYIFPPGHEDERMVSGEDSDKSHVDTSCISLSKSAASLLPAWAMMPHALSPICDRVFFYLIQKSGIACGWTEKYTVLYEAHYSDSYRQLGLPIPDDVHDVDFDKIKSNYSERECFERLGVGLSLKF